MVTKMASHLELCFCCVSLQVVSSLALVQLDALQLAHGRLLLLGLIALHLLPFYLHFTSTLPVVHALSHLAPCSVTLH